jgi:hypothetical protein
MQDDYYQNILYPFQDKILNIIGSLPVEFYLTGGTALSRAYLYHRYSDDLDFFLNGVTDFKSQVSKVLKGLAGSGLKIETSVADEGFARIFVIEKVFSLKLDFVNDVPFRKGTPVSNSLFKRTDNIINILSNKVTALGRYSPKDVVDIIYICENFNFNWENILNDASEKDIWVNPVNVVDVLEKFPVEKINEIVWINKSPSEEWIASGINKIIPEILDGCNNSMFK